MKLNYQKTQMAMARACMTIPDIIEATGLPATTVRGAFKRQSTKPATIGRIAKALGVDPADIVEEGE